MKRLYPDQPIVGVGAVVIKDGKILLAKRRNEPGRGEWSVPGGIVELGESIEQTVLREVKEETGLDVEKPQHIDIVDNVVRDDNGQVKYHFVVLDFLVKLKNGVLQAGSDAEELRWAALSEVESYDLTKTFREFFARNRQELERISGY